MERLRKSITLPSWVHALIVLALTALTLETVSGPGNLNPGGSLGVTSVVLPLLLVAGWVWQVVRAVRWCWGAAATLLRNLATESSVRRAEQPPTSTQRGHRACLAVTWACIVLVASAFVVPWPVRCRFRAARPEFEQRAAVALAAAGATTAPTVVTFAGGRIGSYQVDDIMVFPSRAVFFRVHSASPVSLGGAFVYSVAERPEWRDCCLLDAHWSVDDMGR